MHPSSATDACSPVDGPISEKITGEEGLGHHVSMGIVAAATVKERT
jgi:hypothetical protein